MNSFLGRKRLLYSTGNQLLKSRHFYTCQLKQKEQGKNTCSRPRKTTEYRHRVETDTFWRKFHHNGKICQGWCGEDGGCTPTPFHSIYHHLQSCDVRSSWEGWYTHPISFLVIYLLCEEDPQIVSIWVCLCASAGEMLGYECNCVRVRL